MSIQAPSDSGENQNSTRIIRKRERTSLDGIFGGEDSGDKRGCLKRQSQRMFSQKRIDELQAPLTSKSIKSNRSIQFKKTKMVYTYNQNGKTVYQNGKVQCCQLI